MSCFRGACAAAAASVLLLSACASNRYCLGEQKYDNAENRPPLTVVDGLKLPESATALRIPPPPPATVPFGVKDSKGNGVCLDKPPPMPLANSPIVPPATPAKS